MKFNRWKPTRRTSIAYNVFKIHHTEINHLYWANHAAYKGAYSLTRGKSPSDDADSVFPDPKKERRRTITLAKWSEDYNAFDNWTRLAAVIAITGYFEVFIKSIVEAACQSCPAILVGGHREIEGVKLLKARAKYNFLSQSEACSQGTWQTRLNAYKRIFGSCPKPVEDVVSDLDKLRNLRNSVGHAFGRTLEPAKVGRQIAPEDAKQVKQKALLEYLALVDEVAWEIERHLTPNFIGCYETIAAYHYWDGKRGDRKQIAKKFSSFFRPIVKTTASSAYFLDVINYYQSL